MQRELEVFRTYVRQRGMRMTPERMALFEEIFSRHEHVDADRLHAEMERNGRKISRASVYRNLDLLAESGLVRKHRLDRNRFLYEHIHVGLTHDHLVCQECGRVVEFVSPGIEAMQNEICRAHGFEPHVHSLQITGLCRDCASRRAGAPTAASPP
jgi:Fur family ferric uptake transcriptional regulator